MSASVQVGLAALGFVETAADPESPTATQTEVPAHETLLRVCVPSMVDTVHVGVAAAGFVEIAAFPS